MKIKKIAPSAGVLATVSNLTSDSQKDTYSCDYLNKRNVIVSSEEPTTGEEVWIERSKNLISSKNFVSGVWNTSYTIDDNDKITVTIPKETTAVAYLKTNSFIIPKGKHTFSAKIDGKYTQMKLIDVNDTSVAIIDTTNTYFTTNFDNDMIVFLYIYMSASSTSNVMTIENIQLEVGSVATSYEPFITKKIHTKTDKGYEEFYNEENKEVYSTIEQRIGNWLGKPLYRKVIQTTLPTSDNSQTISVETDIETMLPLKGFAFQSGGTNRVNLTLPYVASSTSIKAHYDIVNNSIVVSNSVSWMNNQPCYIIYEYTKTTD